MVTLDDAKLPLWTCHALDSSIESTAPHVPGWRKQFAKSDVLESLSLPRPNTTQPRQRRHTNTQLAVSMPASPRLSTPYSPRAVTPATPRASTPASPRARAAAVPAPWATLDPWAAAPPRNPTVLLQQRGMYRPQPVLMNDQVAPVVRILCQWWWSYQRRSRRRTTTR